MRPALVQYPVQHRATRLHQYSEWLPGGELTKLEVPRKPADQFGTDLAHWLHEGTKPLGNGRSKMSPPARLPR
jgi:hypothetical protein